MSDVVRSVVDVCRLCRDDRAWVVGAGRSVISDARSGSTFWMASKSGRGPKGDMNEWSNVASVRV